MVTAFEIRQADFQKLVATKPQACMKLLMAICTQFGLKVAANKDALRSLVARGLYRSGPPESPLKQPGGVGYLAPMVRLLALLVLVASPAFAGLEG